MSHLDVCFILVTDVCGDDQYKVSNLSRCLNRAAPKASRAEPRTAPLTIFYAGTVNVCDNVPEDKVNHFTFLVNSHV
jgi:hypothetical protein